MPYKIAKKGEHLIEDEESLEDLTELQADALTYLNKHKDRFIHAAEMAEYYGYPSGIYFRGVLASLHKKGLLLKGEE